MFFAAYGALLALCAVAFVRARTRLLVVLGAIFVLTAVVPLGGNPVVGPIVIAIFRALLPYSLLLRTPQHLMFIMALVVPMMVYLSARIIPRRFFGPSLAAAALVIVAYGQGFFLHSGFFGLIGPFRETNGERATVAFAGAPENDGYRTMFVPNEPGFYFHPAIFDYYFEGSDDPQIRFLPGMTMGAGQKWTPYDRTQQMLKALDEFVPDGADAATQTMLLRMAGVGHLVVHHIGVPTAGVRLKGQNDRAYLESTLRGTGSGNARAVVARSLDLAPQKPGRARVRARLRFRRAAECRSVRRACTRAGCFVVLEAGCDVHRGRGGAFGVYRFAGNVSRRTDARNRVRPAGFQRADRTGRPRNEGFYATVPPKTQDVEILKVPPLPARATGIAFRMHSSEPRRVYVQLYSPNETNFLQASIDFSGPVQDVGLNFQEFGAVGRPDIRRLRFIRFASTNTHGRDVQLYVGTFRWLYAAAKTR